MLRKICSNRWHKMLSIENESGYWSTEADKARKRWFRVHWLYVKLHGGKYIPYQ